MPYHVYKSMWFAWAVVALLLVAELMFAVCTVAHSAAHASYKQIININEKR